MPIHNYSQITVQQLSEAQRKLGITAGGVPSTRLINTASPLTGGGDLSADRTIGMPASTDLVNGYLTSIDHAAFSAKESVLTFNAPLSRVLNAVSIPVATSLVDGYLSAADFVVFSAKVSSTRAINTTAPLAGGGDLSVDRTLSIPKSTAVVDGYLAAADFTTFAAKESALTFSAPLARTVNTISMPVATSLANGYLSSTDWSTFNNKVSTSRSISTTAPLAGGGDLSANRTLSIPAATTSVDGYLAAADFTTFNAKVATSRSIATTSPVTGGGDLSADRTIALDFTVAWTWTANGIAATPTDRIILSNTTAAALGAQQYSPAIRFTGQGWATTSSTSRAVDWRIYNAAIQGSTNPSANVLIDFSVNGGAFTNVLTLNSNGIMTLALSGLNANGGLRAASTDLIHWNTRSRMSSPSDGVMLFQNAAQTDFTRLQFGGTTSSFPALARSTTTLKARLADDSADCGFTSANFISSTVGVGFNGSAAVGKSSAYTVTNSTPDRTYDANATTLNELAQVVAAIISDLKLVGLFA